MADTEMPRTARIASWLGKFAPSCALRSPDPALPGNFRLSCQRRTRGLFFLSHSIRQYRAYDWPTPADQKTCRSVRTSAINNT